MQNKSESKEVEQDPIQDPYLWLEEVEGDQALTWVRAQNDKTLKELKADPRFSQYEAEALAIYEASDKIAYATIRGNMVYNFWQDEDHIRGIWRRAPLKGYVADEATWETLLDVDALAEAEGENWVYKSVAGLPPAYDRFLIELSRGGKDAVVVREFDVKTKRFLDDGFYVPEAKSTASWINKDRIFISTDFGPGSMTTSGYPAIVKIWDRGTPLDSSVEVARVEVEDLGIWGWSQFFEGGSHKLVSKSWDFWTHEISLVDDQGHLSRLEIPKDADFQGIWKDQILMILRSDWNAYSAGALMAKDLKTNNIHTLFMPDAETSISSVNLSSNCVLVTVQHNVTDEVLRFSMGTAGWESERLDLPQGGVISISGASSLTKDFFYYYEDFLTPKSLGYFSDASAAPRIIKSSPARFDASELVFSQEFTTSADGTRIPYFLVSHKDLPLNSDNPVLLYGYGGFEISEKPQYRSTTGKLWLEKGGVFALANIRGGGEYGPTWHQAALKMNRHKSYEDFIAIAEDLIQKKITNTKKLGIMGGSGGGLLVGSVYVMRPDLFQAMVCQVPLLDMLRYHKLLAGASWMGEYGDPDDPTEGAYLRRYSPYQNIKPDAKYSRALFTTSTKDDRVHPAHARKMVARLMEQGHPVMYYENIEGGHAAGANLKQYATMAAIEYTYLHRQLGVEK